MEAMNVIMQILVSLNSPKCTIAKVFTQEITTRRVPLAPPANRLEEAACVRVSKYHGSLIINGV